MFRKCYNQPKEKNAIEKKILHTKSRVVILPSSSKIA